MLDFWAALPTLSVPTSHSFTVPSSSSFLFHFRFHCCSNHNLGQSKVNRWGGLRRRRRKIFSMRGRRLSGREGSRRNARRNLERRRRDDRKLKGEDRRQTPPSSLSPRSSRSASPGRPYLVMLLGLQPERRGSAKSGRRMDRLFFSCHLRACAL